MNKKLLTFFRLSVFAIALLGTTISSYASHMFGGDLYYTWVSGTTYKITLVIYGDCSGSAFPTLPSSIAEIVVSNGTTTSDTLEMHLQNPASGVEVTPVCPKQKLQTACYGGSLPGIKKFIFSGNINIPDTSSHWLILFDGNLTASSAGRSISITNIVGGSTMILQDTLNNTAGPNSSAEFTTIPTPFFCDNEPANYNPGAVDPDGDSLSIRLVPALDGFAGTVSYNTGYSATSPLAVVSGSFRSDNTSGQLSFTPNQLQKSLVVEQVNKYKNGKLVGTSMREMTFVVINCNNTPPKGSVSNIKGGIILDSADVEVCSSQGPFSFEIDPTDADGANVTVTAQGLPTGATFNVDSNNTTNPIGTFSWNVTGVKPGKYTFFLTFKGDECPLGSTQSQAYSVTVLQGPDIESTQTGLGSCNTRGLFRVISQSPYILNIYNSNNKPLDTIKMASDTLIDSLPVGTYTIYVTNSLGCISNVPLSVNPYPPIVVDNVTTTPATCNGYETGTMTIKASGGDAPYLFTIDSLVQQLNGDVSFAAMNRPSVVNGYFDSLLSGVYQVTIADANRCFIDTVISVSQPDSILLTTTTTPNGCIGIDTSGVALVATIGGTPPYRYLWNTKENETDSIITQKPNGIYTVYVHDKNNCEDSAMAMIGYDDCCTPYIPSAFTPNGDGKNDVFRLRFKGDIKLENFSIYNRYGQRVFSTIYPDHGWDGTFAGTVQDMGTYFYYIKFICGDKGDHEVELSGNVTLIR